MNAASATETSPVSDSRLDRCAVSRKSGQRAGYIRNRDQRDLFVHEMFPTAPTHAAVIFCAPFGEERQKSYRPMYHLAQSLAAVGIACVRFDYAGTGDSEGDSADMTIASMIADTCDVVDYLRAGRPLGPLYVVGTRFGATIAAMLAEERPDVAGIGLLFPVIDGRRYWADLQRQHKLALLGSGMKPPGSEELSRQLRDVGHVEIESSRLTSALVEQMTALDLGRWPAAYSGRVFVALEERDVPAQEPISELLVRCESTGCETQQYVHRGRDYWSLRSMYDYYLPYELFGAVSEWLAT